MYKKLKERHREQFSYKEIAEPKGIVVGNSMEDHFRKYKNVLFQNLILFLGALLQ